MKGKVEADRVSKHIDGDVPMCMRNKGKDDELKSNKAEKVTGEGGGRERFRHVDGDVPMYVDAKQRWRERV